MQISRDIHSKVENLVVAVRHDSHMRLVAAFLPWLLSYRNDVESFYAATGVESNADAEATLNAAFDEYCGDRLY